MSGFTDLMAQTYTDTTNVDEALNQGVLKKALVGGQDYFECLVCHRSMAGIVPAQAHLKGSPHFKAIRNIGHLSPLNDVLRRMQINENVLTEQRHHDIPGASGYSGNTSDEEMVKKAMEEGIVTRSNAVGVTSLTCEICKVSCTGEAPMAQHLDGEPHRKRQRKMGTSQQAGPVVSRLSLSPVRPVSRQSVSPVRPASEYTYQTSFSSGLNSSEEGDSLKKAFEDGIVEQDSSGGVDNLTCKVCLKSCTGSVPMRQHLKSSTHIKKLRIHVLSSGGNQLAARPSFNTFADGKIAIVMEARDYEEEGVSSSSVEPASSSTAKDSTAEAEYGEMVIEVDGLLMCLVCQLQCTGKANMAEHLQGDHHRRKWRDQMDQLKMFGIADVPKIQPPPVSKPLPSERIPSERLQGSVPLAVSQSNPSNQSSRNYSVRTTVSVLRTGVVPKRRSINLPPNLSDLEVYFPREPLGRNF